MKKGIFSNKNKGLTLSAFLIIIIVLTSYYFRPSRSELIITVSLSIATFLFGIFSGFSISDRHARIERIRANDSSERSNIVSIFHLSKVFGKNHHEKIANELDEYLMSTLDYTIEDFGKTEKEFEDISKMASSLKAPVNDLKKGTAYREMIKLLDNSRLLRGETAEIANERLSKFEWIIQGFLGFVILTALVLISDGSVLSTIIVASLSSVVILLSYFLYSLDSLSWKAEARIFEPYSQTFESIGFLRYYPDELLDSGRIRKHQGKNYRVGLFPNPYPDMSGKKIKIVKNK